MAIRVRQLTREEIQDAAVRKQMQPGMLYTVALCAAESAPRPGDVYLDDNVHYALVAKIRQDHGLPADALQTTLMATQKMRDAYEVQQTWRQQQEQLWKRYQASTAKIRTAYRGVVGYVFFDDVTQTFYGRIKGHQDETYQGETLEKAIAMLHQYVDAIKALQTRNTKQGMP